MEWLCVLWGYVLFSVVPKASILRYLKYIAEPFQRGNRHSFSIWTLFDLDGTEPWLLKYICPNPASSRLDGCCLKVLWIWTETVLSICSVNPHMMWVMHAQKSWPSLPACCSYTTWSNQVMILNYMSLSALISACKWIQFRQVTSITTVYIYNKTISMKICLNLNKLVLLSHIHFVLFDVNTYRYIVSFYLYFPG